MSLPAVGPVVPWVRWPCCAGGGRADRPANALWRSRGQVSGRPDDSLAARRSLGVAGVGSDRAEPAMRRGEQEAR